MAGVEVLALIGILASIEQLVEASGRLVKTAIGFYRDSKELPKTLQELQTFLPGLAMAIRRRSDLSVLERLNGPDRQILTVILNDLQGKIQELGSLLQDYLPVEDASSGMKLMKAMESFGVEKKIDRLVNIVFERYIPLLNFAMSGTLMLPSELIPTTSAAASSESGGESKPHFLVKVQRDDDFVGRTDVMDRLNLLLSPVKKHNRVALIALGGMGKTRIALEFALRYKVSTDTSVFWVHASSASRISEGYDEIVRKAKLFSTADLRPDGLQPTESIKMNSVKDWLESDASGRWLLVFDNADDQDLIYGTSQMANYFPRSDKGSIIMTTRDKAVGIKFTGTASRVIVIQALDFSTSRALLEGKLGQDAVASEEVYQELIEELEGVPLALVQAAAFINEQSIDVQQYLDIYRSSEAAKINLLSEDFEDAVRTAQDSKSPIAATWIISFETIKRRDPIAAAILSRMCIMDSHALPISLLESGDRTEDIIKGLGTLQAFSMITPRKIEVGVNGTHEKTFDLHRLVRLSMRNWLKLHEQLDFWMAATLKTLSQRYPDLESTEGQRQQKWIVYLPHALIVLNSDQFKTGSKDGSITRVFKSQVATGQHAADGVICGLCAAKLMLEVSKTFEHLQSQPAECSYWACQALALREHILGNTHSDTLESMFQYTKALYKESKINESRVIGTRFFELVATTEQPLSHQARSLRGQGAVLTELGLFEKAEAYYRQSVDMCKEYYGLEHVITLSSMEQLASNYTDQGRFEDSEKLLIQILEIQKRLFGPEYRETLRVTRNLSAVYFKMRRYEEAERMASMLSVTGARILGPKNPQTMVAMSDLAATYYSTGRYEESIKLGLRVSELETEVLGPDHRTTLSSLWNLSQAYEKLGRLDDAENLRSDILERQTRVLGVQHKHTVVTMIDLAALYEQRKKFAAAETLRLQVLQIQIDLSRVQSDVTIQAIQNLMRHYEIRKRYLDVAAVGLDLVNVLEAAYGPKYPEIQASMASIASAWLKLGRVPEANELVRSAIERGRDILELENLIAIFCKRILGCVAYRMSYYSEAEIIFREILSILEKAHNPDKSIMVDTMSEFATFLIAASRFPEAERTLKSADELCSSISKPEVAIKWRIIEGYALLNICRGRYCESERSCMMLLKEECDTWTSKDTLGVQHLEMLAMFEGLGQVYSRTEAYTRANQVLALTRRAYLKLLGPKNPKTLNAMLWDCSNQLYIGRKEDTLTLCLCAKERLEAIYPPTHEDITFAHLTLARLCLLNGEYEAAEESALQALSSGKQAFGKNHLLVICAGRVLGAANLGQGKLIEAEKQLVEAISASVTLLGPQNFLAISIQAELAKTYEKQGQGREADAVALKMQVEEDRKGLDFGLSEEQRKESDGFVQDVINWLEMEVSQLE